MNHHTAPYDRTKHQELPRTVVTAANLILVGAGVACLLVLSYYSYYYGWSGQRRFTTWAGVLAYIVFPAALAVLFLASLRLRPSRKVNLALVLCSAVVSLCMLEVLLTVWFSLPSVRDHELRKLRAESAKALGLPFDTRSERVVVRDLVRQGADAIPSLFPQAFLRDQGNGTVKSPISVNGTELFPLGAIANKLVVLCNEAGRFVTYRSDEHGFNNPQGLWVRVPADVVAVGDSFTHGYCTDNHFVALIRKRYPVTLNLGMEGNGPLVMLATIKEYARVVRPKVVLWFYYEGNDLREQTRERKSPLLTRYLTTGFSQDLLSRQAEIDRALSDYLEVISNRSDLSIKLEELSDLIRDVNLRDLRKGVVGVLKLAATRQRLGLVRGHSTTAAPGPHNGPYRDHGRSRTDLLYATLVEAKQSVNDWGGSLYFVYLPNWNRYGSRILGQERENVLSAAARARLPVVDIHQIFIRQQDPLALFPFRLPLSHYNEAGHRLVAEAVLESISVVR